MICLRCLVPGVVFFGPPCSCKGAQPPTSYRSTAGQSPTNICPPVDQPAQPQLQPRALMEARENLLRHLDQGINCPCCGQYAKRYRRKLNSGIAVWLILLVRLYRDSWHKHEHPGWVHVSQIIRTGSLLGASSAGGSGQAQSLLPLWGLVETQPNVAPDKRASGLWRPTPNGIAFAEGKITVPERVVVYNNTLEGFEGDQITIQSALGKKFSYTELMSVTAAV